jgi:hypothetical protein
LLEIWRIEVHRRSDGIYSYHCKLKTQKAKEDEYKQSKELRLDQQRMNISNANLARIRKIKNGQKFL